MKDKTICNCIKETEERYKEHLKNNDKTFKDMEDFEVEFANKAYMFGSGKTEIVLPIEVEWKHTAKSKRVSTKKKTSNFTMTYCPFCGEKQSEESGENE